ncbi:MAG: GDSL-type esterase/lipase family protein [Chloroflexi bacterium]|nr:GDSL-type esterase/lipase family protein [Chloroflexota bacterium]MDA1281443.1 GDSL-type esterase/lipase family protein [Chloroflexota bacterium]
MPQHIAANDPHLTWSGAISTEVSNEWVMPWRINHQQRELYDSELALRAAMAAGVRVTFHSDTTAIEGTCNLFEERGQIDLVVDDKLVASVNLANQSSFRFENLSAGNKNIELWLPQFGETRLSGLGIDVEAKISAPSESSAKKWITYGSSISQCSAADSPTKTWPAIVARTRGYDLTCLGFGGQCHLDPMIARVIRDSEADLISMCLGINIYGSGSLNQRTFYPGILGFVQIVREKHPTTPIVLISPIYSPGRETELNDVGFSLRHMRDEVKLAYETLKAHGDENIRYVNGLDVFGSDKAHLLPDDLHPNNEGYGIMVDNLLGLLPKI